jgi:hypothetical protein
MPNEQTAMMGRLEHKSFAHKSLAKMVAGLALFVTVSLSATTVMAESNDAYVRYYGDGLRHYAEGDFGAAVQNLFRAYALDSKPSTLGLIVTSYDKMGYCDAAERQLGVHRLVHPDAGSPELIHCSSTGTVEIACKGPEADVTVDRQFQVSCGQRIALPVGEHRLSAERVDSPRRFTVQAGRTARVELAFAPAPTRWNTASSRTQSSKEPDAVAQIDRLERGGLDYTVFESPDGLYRIFVHPGSAASGGVLPLQLRPDVLRLCDSGESFDPASSHCIPLQGMQIQKME